MYVREWFGFPPPAVRVDIGYDPEQDVVFLTLDRKGVALSAFDVLGLVADLMDLVAEQHRSTRV